MPLPDLCIIGAQKCGTTTLHACLVSHSEIHGPVDPQTGRPIKEIEFFGKHWTRGLEWYQSHFRPAGGVHLDSTPNYLCNIAAHGRMRHTVPDARLIVTLRDPVDRAFSQFNHYSQRIEKSQDWDWRRPGGSFVENVRAELEEPHYPWFGLLGRGKYGEQLEHLLQHFPRKQVKVVVMEQWTQNPDACFDAILDFALLPRQSLQKVALHIRPYTVEPMDEEVEQLLTDFYRPSNEQLFELLGEPIDEWRH